MNKIWTQKWKAALIWMSAYLSFIAYALVGGYVILKSDDEHLNKTAKNAFVVTIIFAALSAFLSLYNYIFGFASGYYGSAAYEIYSVCSTLVGIAKIVTYAVFVIMELRKQEETVAPQPVKAEPEATDEPVNEESSEENN